MTATSQGYRAGFVLTAAVLALGLAGAGCASMGGAEIIQARTGEQVVRVKSSCSFDDLARQVWGDEQRGREIAALAHLPYDQPCPRGTVLVLPPPETATPVAESAQTADSRYRDGLIAAKNGQYAQAAARFREALLLDPQRVEVRFNLGLALLESGEVTEATPVLEEVARQRPRHAESRYAYGAVLRKKRQYDRALGEFQAALDIDSGHRKAAYAMARTLEDMGQTARAQEAWRRFLGKFPNDPLAPDAARRLAALKAGKRAEPDSPDRASP